MKKTVFTLFLLTIGAAARIASAQESAETPPAPELSAQTVAAQESASAPTTPPAPASSETAPAIQQAPALTFEQALQAAVENNPGIQLKKAAVQAARAKLLSAKAGTDFVIGADAQYIKQHQPFGSDPYSVANGYNDIENDSISASLWAQKTFSFGLQTKVSANIASALNTYHGEKSGDYKLMYGDEFTNRGSIMLKLSLPLFKSFKNAVLANNIQAAKDYCAQLEFELVDTICQTMQNVATAYWDYLNAYNDALQLEEMLEVLRSRVNAMDKMITAGARTKNDLLSMQVNIIANERASLLAKVTLNKARLLLQQAMGTDEEPGIPEYSFPNIDFEKIKALDLQNVDKAFIEKIVSSRPDIISLQKGLDSARANLACAIAQGRPDLSINLSVGETGAVYGESAGGFFSSFFRNVNGANLGGGLSFSMSLPNNAKKGAVASAEALCTQASVRLNQAKQALALQLRNTVFSLNSFKTQALNANSALEMQKQLYANQQRRFDSGLITVDDMIKQDEDYLSAKSQYYQIMTTFLQNIMEYKHCVGTLVEITDGDTNKLRKDSLYSLQ